jgi:hypothetical protein
MGGVVERYTNAKTFFLSYVNLVAWQHYVSGGEKAEMAAKRRPDIADRN